MAKLERRKVLSYEEAPQAFAKLRDDGKTIVQCHGTFDLIHPGHVVHFEEAKAAGDVLVVTVTAEEHVNKGPGRPYFNDAMRVRWLAALESVDYVVVVPFPAAVEAIRCVRPHVYCKGKEYENQNNDVTGNIADDVSTVLEGGGEIRYVGSVVFSSSRLLNQHFDTYKPALKEYCSGIASQWPFEEFRKLVEAFADLRVVIIGDIIFDRYTTLEVQGLTSKNRIISGRFLSEEMQAGGALAVFRHIREFTPNVKLISIVGTETWTEEVLSRFIAPEEEDIVRSAEFTTVVKQRFVEPKRDGKELSKLFSVNFIDKQHPTEHLQKALIERLKPQLDACDVVVVMDFGHGALEQAVREFVQDHAGFLALNCQTNSNNHGFNIINRQYRRADCFTLDQAEITLAVGGRQFDFRNELANLARNFNSSHAWLTLGGTKTIGFSADDDVCECVPFEDSIVDTLGAGDAFCAVATLAATKRLPISLATFMGQLAGAQAVRIVGNSEPIRKSRFLKAANSMLAF